MCKSRRTTSALSVDVRKVVGSLRSFPLVSVKLLQHFSWQNKAFPVVYTTLEVYQKTFCSYSRILTFSWQYLFKAIRLARYQLQINGKYCFDLNIWLSSSRLELTLFPICPERYAFPSCHKSGILSTIRLHSSSRNRTFGGGVEEVEPYEIKKKR